MEGCMVVEMLSMKLFIRGNEKMSRKSENYLLTEYYIPVI